MVMGIRPRVLGLLHRFPIEIPHVIVERRLLRGIRDRAESRHPERSAAARSAAAENLGGVRYARVV
jgi:hypothetical protein